MAPGIPLRIPVFFRITPTTKVFRWKTGSNLIIAPAGETRILRTRRKAGTFKLNFPRNGPTVTTAKKPAKLLIPISNGSRRKENFAGKLWKTDLKSRDRFLRELPGRAKNFDLLI